jgi:hypothetical protein
MGIRLLLWLAHALGLPWEANFQPSEKFIKIKQNKTTEHNITE